MNRRVIQGVAWVGMPALILGLLIPLHFRDTKSGKADASVSQSDQQPIQTGLASFYHLPGKKTASGEQFDPAALTAAHKKLRLGSRARVTNVESGKTISVRINDRGPYAGGRIIDLSKRAAEVIGIGSKGISRVEVQPEGNQP
jgi:rare lipoprotein A (peptidoglycan hydrolase)